MNNVIELINRTSNGTDDYGNPIYHDSFRSVFAEMKSISQKEFYEAQALGLKPEIKFVIADYYDYNNETKVKFENKIYNILRTFRSGNNLEIVVTKEAE